MQSLNKLKRRVKSVPTGGDVPCTPVPGSPVTAGDPTPFRRPAMHRRFQPETPARQHDFYLRSGVNKTPRTKAGRSSDSPKANPSGKMPQAALRWAGAATWHRPSPPPHLVRGTFEDAGRLVDGFCPQLQVFVFQLLRGPVQRFGDQSSLRHFTLERQTSR